MEVSMNTVQNVSIERLLDNFEIEELEERLEFVTWSCSVTASSANGGTVSGTCGVSG